MWLVDSFVPYALTGVTGSIQLLNGLVLRLQDDFTHGSGTWVGLTKDWALLRLSVGVPTCGLPSMVASGLQEGVSCEQNRSYMAFYDLQLEVTQHYLCCTLLANLATSLLRFKGRGHRSHLSVGGHSENVQLCFKSPTDREHVCSLDGNVQRDRER